MPREGEVRAKPSFMPRAEVEAPGSADDGRDPEDGDVDAADRAQEGIQVGGHASVGHALPRLAPRWEVRFQPEALPAASLRRVQARDVNVP